MRFRGRRLIASGVLLALVAACTGGGSDSPEFGDLSAEEAQYGLAPQPTGDVELQDDVVIVGGGASSVKAVSSDGVTWTVDGSASNADDLEVGEVMFLTSRAVGRVLAVERDGDDVVVALGPVDVTDVIRNGTFDYSAPVDVDSLITQESPGLAAWEVPAPLPENAAPAEETTPPEDDVSSYRRPVAQEPPLPPCPIDGTTTTTAPCYEPPDLREDDWPPPTLPRDGNQGGDGGTGGDTGGGGGGGDGDGDGGDDGDDAPADPTPGRPGTPGSPGGSGGSGGGPSDIPREEPLGDKKPKPKAPSAIAAACGPGFQGPQDVGPIDPLFKPQGLNPNAQPAPAPNPQPSPQPSQSVEVAFGPVVAEAQRSPNKLAVIVKGRTQGVELGVEVCFDVKDPKVDARMVIVDGKVVDGRLLFHGIHAVTVSAGGGSANGLSDNFKVKAEMPFDWNIPVSIYGVPFNLMLKTKFLVETAFSAKNSTLGGGGKYGVAGPIGFTMSNGSLKAETPQVTVLRKIMDSLTGVSVGVNGLVWAVQLKAQFGLGTAAMNAGPYGAVTFAMGVTVGSDLGIVKCLGATLDVTGAVGLGFILGNAVKSVLEKIKKEFKLETELAVLTQQLYHRDGVTPKVPICGG